MGQKDGKVEGEITNLKKKNQVKWCKGVALKVNNLKTEVEKIKVMFRWEERPSETLGRGGGDGGFGGGALFGKV